MRAAVILGLGCSPRQLAPFQEDKDVRWTLGLPASPEETDAIVIFGGDGTIHRHLGKIQKLGLPLLVVPSGSGNDFARALGIRSFSDSLQAWRAFCQGQKNVRTIDLGTITSPDSSHLFCCVAGIGLDAEVARRANHLPRWLRARGGYALSLLPTIFRFAPFPAKVSILGDKNDWNLRSDRPMLLAAFANAPIYGGGMKIAPDARMNDGLLDACVIEGIDPFRLFCLFPTVYSGNHVKIKEVVYFKAARARVETEHPMDVYADGEFVCRTPVEIGIQPQALTTIF